MSMMRCEEPGYEQIAVPDGRRGLWARVTRSVSGAIEYVEMAAGREGDDAYVKLTAGEPATAANLAALDEVLSCLRYAAELASEGSGE